VHSTRNAAGLSRRTSLLCVDMLSVTRVHDIN
jgi:hypothetical protein